MKADSLGEQTFRTRETSNESSRQVLIKNFQSEIIFKGKKRKPIKDKSEENWDSDFDGGVSVGTGPEKLIFYRRSSIF